MDNTFEGLVERSVYYEQFEDFERKVENR